LVVKPGGTPKEDSFLRDTAGNIRFDFQLEDMLENAPPTAGKERVWHERLYDYNEVYKQKLQTETSQREEERVQQRTAQILNKNSAKLSQTRFRAAAG
jgi:hypothetical protein